MELHRERASTLQILIASVIVVAGVASLAISPIPLGIAGSFAALGFLCGILYSLRDQALSFIAMFVMYMGLDYLDKRAAVTFPPIATNIWQPATIAFSALIVAYTITRRLRGLPLTSD